MWLKWYACWVVLYLNGFAHQLRRDVEHNCWYCSTGPWSHCRTDLVVRWRCIADRCWACLQGVASSHCRRQLMAQVDWTQSAHRLTVEGLGRTQRMVCATRQHCHWCTVCCRIGNFALLCIRNSKTLTWSNWPLLLPESDVDEWRAIKVNTSSDVLWAF